MNCEHVQTPKRSPSAAARAANTEASARAAASRINAVDINPQFVVVRDFRELDSTVRAVKAGPLPIRSTVYNDVGRPLAPFPSLGGDRSSVKPNPDGTYTTKVKGSPEAGVVAEAGTMDSPTKSGSGLTTGNTSATTANGDGSKLCHHPLGVDRSASTNSLATLSSPLRSASSPTGSGGRVMHPGTSPLFGPQHPRSPSPAPAGQPNNAQRQPSGLSNSGNRSRSPRPAAARKMLFIWDVDDTLVASGAAGTRQNTLFSSSQLVPLFKALPNARHLLLSQGSIDDVFYPNRGRLRYLEKFFRPTSASESDGGGAASPGDDRVSVSSTASSTTTADGKQKKKSSGSIFSCGGTKEKTPSTDEVTVFEKGTSLIRLTTVRGSVEEENETAFMYHAGVKPKLHGGNSKDQIRWLVLRPTTWGITLATLNSLFTPSLNTACVDGKVFHKMDVAWSLAKSGLWDSVFFIDNNLSEVGIVKHGMNMNDVLELQHTHHMYRFFHAEFLLLAASAKIRQLEKQYGCDVTVPVKKAGSPAKDAATKAAEDPRKNRFVDDVDGIRFEDDTNAATAEAIPDLRERARTDDPFVNESLQEAAAQQCKEVDEISLASSDANDEKTGEPARGSRSTQETRAEAAASPSPRAAAPPSASLDPTFGRGGVCRQVDFVVAHLHLETEAYRKIMLGNRSGTGIGAKNGDVIRCTGQPTFNGDSSLTDDQYEAVLAFFRAEESTMYQLIDEDMRHNGYVDMGEQRRFGPNSRYVHMPVYRRPVSIPHMRSFYEKIGNDVETRVVQPLLKGGGLIRGASVIRGDAHILCTTLLRAGPFIDPLVQGGLALELFMVYAAEGNVDKVSGEYVHKAVRKLLDDPNAKGKKSKK